MKVCKFECSKASLVRLKNTDVKRESQQMLLGSGNFLYEHVTRFYKTLHFIAWV